MTTDHDEQLNRLVEQFDRQIEVRNKLTIGEVLHNIDQSGISTQGLLAAAEIGTTLLFAAILHRG